MMGVVKVEVALADTQIVVAVVLTLSEVVLFRYSFLYVVDNNKYFNLFSVVNNFINIFLGTIAYILLCREKKKCECLKNIYFFLNTNYA